jgi:hypothetical protein
MLSVVSGVPATQDAPVVLPPEIADEFERLVADLDHLTGSAAAVMPSTYVLRPESDLPPAAQHQASARSWRQIFAEDPGLVVTCAVMMGTALVVLLAWLHVLARLDTVERRSASAEERATIAASAAATAPDALRTAANVQRMMRVQSAVDVVQLTARAGAGPASVQGHLWWSPSVGLAMWARPVPIPADADMGYHAWLITDAGTDYLGPVMRDEAGTITASFDPPPHATSKVISVLVSMQPSFSVDRPGDLVVLEAKF